MCDGTTGQQDTELFWWYSGQHSKSRSWFFRDFFCAADTDNEADTESDKDTDSDSEQTNTETNDVQSSSARTDEMAITTSDKYSTAVNRVNLWWLENKGTVQKLLEDKSLLLRPPKAISSLAWAGWVESWC